jgi:hypothetical protein
MGDTRTDSWGRRRWGGLLAAACAGAIAVVACANGSKAPGASSEDAGSAADATVPACTPGQQFACPCSGGGKGVQVCSQDGRSFGPCTGCTAPSSSSGSGSSSGSSGSDPPGDGGPMLEDTGLPPLDASSLLDAVPPLDGAPGLPDGQACNTPPDTGIPDCDTCVARSCDRQWCTCIADTNVLSDDAGMRPGCVAYIQCVSRCLGTDAGSEFDCVNILCAGPPYTMEDKTDGRDMLSCIATNCSAMCP